MRKERTIKKIERGALFFYTEYFGDPKDPTCLLIAGAMAPLSFWTETFCELLAYSGFFVIRYDQRDIGESCSVNWQKNPYTLSDLASDVIIILDAYGIKKAHFVGHSMGGYITQILALEYPENTHSITMISAGPLGATKETDSPLTKTEIAIQENTWKIFLERKDGPSKETMIQSFLPVWKHLNGNLPLDEEMAYSYTKDLILRSQHPIMAGNNHELVMRTLDLEKNRGALQKITVPALIIQGDSDPLILPKNGYALAHALPKSTLMMIPHMGHMLFNKKLEETIINLINQHITNFFERS